MQSQSRSLATEHRPELPETLEIFLSALVGCGLVLLLAFFLSLESWLVGTLG